MRKVNFTETVLRDGNQSLIATRMKFEQMAPILAEIDKVGYNSIEMWGGATYDSCIRFLNEDPWERLRKIKSVVKNTKLQMLLRGQNVLGYKHYPDEFVRKFIDHAVETGIDIVRVFDALNDLQNIRVAMEEVVKQGAHAQGTIVYTVSPIHDIKNYENLAKQIEEMGASSICIKDMAGLLMPSVAYELVKNLKSTVKIPIQLHCHCTNGIAEMAYWEAIRAGVDGIDCAISSFSSGSSQPPTEALNFALLEAGYETGLDPVILKTVNDYFKTDQSGDDYFRLAGYICSYSAAEGLVYQIPGGMLTNLISQLKAQNAIEKLDAVLNEVPRVRKDLGYPPLVTTTSQIVGTQAVMNILGGEPYKMIIKEVINYFLGEYGHVPGPINPDIAKKALRKKVPIRARYADTLEPVFDKTKEQL